MDYNIPRRGYTQGRGNLHISFGHFFASYAGWESAGEFVELLDGKVLLLNLKGNTISVGIRDKHFHSCTYLFPEPFQFVEELVRPSVVLLHNPPKAFHLLEGVLQQSVQETIHE